MPDPTQIAKTLQDGGGWFAFLSLVVLIGITGYRRGWVWGWMYDRSEARAQTAETQAERNADSLETMATAYEVMGRSYDRLERDLDRFTSGRVNRE